METSISELPSAAGSPAPPRRLTRGRSCSGYAKASGRPFNNLLDALSWPDKEALMILRNRSAVINLTDENVRTLTDRWEVVYSFDAT